MGVRLPTEYQEVEYLGSDGSAYIDSGIECTSDLVVDFAFSGSTVANTAVCGGIKLSGGPPYFRHHATPVYGGGYSSFYWCQYSSVEISSVRAFYEVDKKYAVSINPVTGSATINSIDYTFTPLASGLTTGKSYGIFARIADTGALQGRPSKFYNFKFYRNNSLIGHFIPCYRKSDDKPGMYDLISNTFFVNQGTGEFTVGNDVVDSISPWMVARRRSLMREPPLRGLDFDGTFYFKTEYVPTADTQVIVQFSCDNNISSNMPIFGSRTNANAGSFYAWARVDEAKKMRIERFASHSSASWNNIVYKLENQNIYIIDTDASTLSENGVAVANWSYIGTVFTGNNYPLFIGQINNGGYLMPGLKFTGKIYSFKILENGVVVRNYVPYNDKLKDRITGQVLEKYYS